MPAELYVKRSKRCFDMIFCDPPFFYQYKWELLWAISSSQLVKDQSLLMIHRPKDDNPLIDEYGYEGAHLFRENYREYGRSIVDFFRVKKDQKNDYIF